MLKDVLANMHLIFDEIILERGKFYQKQGRILSVRLSEGLIKGRVKGNQSQLYDVHINLRSDAEQFARCTCPYTVNCKHAAACLLELQVRKNITIARPLVANDGNNHWLRSVGDTQPTTINEQSSAYVVQYEIDFDKKHRRGIPVRLYRVKRLKNGELGKSSEMKKEDDISSRLSATDQILSMKILAQSSMLDRPNNIRDVDTLQKIVDTGQAFIKATFSAKRKKLAWGDPLEVKLKWLLTADGHFKLSLLDQQHQSDAIFIWRPPFYVDKEEGLVRLLKSDYSQEVLKSLMKQEPIPLQDFHADNDTIYEQAPRLPDLPLVKTSSTPIPLIKFNAIKLWQEGIKAGEQAHYQLFLQLQFQYGNQMISVGHQNDHVYELCEKQISVYQRQQALEQTLFDKISTLLDLTDLPILYQQKLNQELDDIWVSRVCMDETNLPKLFNDVVPEVEAIGGKVSFEHAVFTRPIDIDDLSWFSEVEEDTVGHLIYQLGVIIDGKPINLVPLVVDIIQNYSQHELQLMPDNHPLILTVDKQTAVKVEAVRIRPLINFILQFGNKKVTKENQLTLEKHQALWLAEMESATQATSARWQGLEQLRDKIRTFLTQQFDVQMPVHCLATLRDYQIKGVKWLQSLRMCHFSGILADDMGLGKTVQTLAHLQLEKEQGRLLKPVLIVAPTSLVMNWYQEAHRFTPDLNVLVYHGSDRNHEQIGAYDLVITSYGLIQRDKAQFIDKDFYYLVLDEAQFIKNARAKTTLVVQQLNATHRLCLTGTPLENHLGELWSLFHFLMPGFLGTARQFRHLFKYPIEKLHARERQVALANLVRPFLLRRNKQEVATELPSKTTITRMVEFEDGQRDLYEAIRMTMEKKVRQAIAEKGIQKSQLIILDALLKMRQVCCDPNLLAESHAQIAKGESAKLDLLEDLLVNSLKEGRRILLFSQFTSMLEIIEARCHKLGLKYVKLTGKSQNRHKIVDSFQSGDVPLFLISLKAGGTGLNLTAADMVIHYDPWWNPAVEDQATDRSHRIGQENPVFVYRLICAGTIEETMLELQEKKRQLITKIYEHHASDNLMELDTVLSLFQPYKSY